MVKARAFGRTAGAALVLTVVLGSLGVLSARPADGQVGGADLRVGVVDLATVFKEYKRSAELEKKINQERDDLKKGLDEVRDKIKEIQKQMDLLDYESEAYKLREEEKAIELARFELMKRRLERTIKTRWEEYNLQLLEDIEKVVQDYGKENHFTLILKVDGEAPAGDQKLLQAGLKNVLYFAKHVDVTEDVVRILNGNYRRDLVPGAPGGGR